MPTSEFVFDDAALHAALEKQSAERLARFASGLDGLLEWRRKHAKSLETFLARDAKLKKHAEQMDAFGKAFGDATAAIAAGKMSRQQAATELRPAWEVISSDKNYALVVDAYRKTKGPMAGNEAAWLDKAFDLLPDARPGWDARYRDLGWEFLKPIEKPAPKENSEFGTIRQELPGGPMPLSLCRTPPFDRHETRETTSGLAVVFTMPMVDPGLGKVSTISSSYAPVVMGGATDSWALVGTDVDWGSGFQTLSITADIDLDSSRLFAIAVLGGSSASAELVLRVTLSDGRVLQAVSTIGSAVAPLLWHTDIRQSGSRKIVLGTIVLNGAAGSARIMAGVHDNTAAVGVIGVSDADSDHAATITRLCAHLI